MNLGTWVGRLLLSTFFVAGYVTYYGSNYYLRLRNNQAQGVQFVLNRLAMLLVPLVLAVGLQLVADTTVVAQNLYLNLQLFVITYPLISDDQVDWEYVLRWVMMIGFWVYNHPFDQRLFVLVAAVFLVQFFVIRRWQQLIRYNFGANTLFAIVMGVLYWGTYRGLDTADLIAYPLFFLVMHYYTFRYWLNLHEAKVERERLTAEVNHDALTGALSLVSLREDGATAFTRAQANGGQLAMAILDIDHFKSFNDDFGHAAGDGVLIGVTKMLQDVIMDDGGDAQLYRTGGEEMTILMSGYSAAAAMNLVRECWERIRTVRVPYKQESFQCTISLGMTTMRASDLKLNELAVRADSSLYQSKQRGRDCITVDGKTEALSNLRTTLMNYTFFTQPLVRVHDNRVLSSELLLRVYDNGEWHLPTNFNVTVPTMMDLIERAIRNMAVKSLCMNYELSELESSAIQDGLRRFAHRHPELDHLVIELSTLDAPERLRALAPVYQEFGVQFAIDSAGMPCVYDEFESVLDLFTLVKIPLQRLRPGVSEARIATIITEWQTICKQKGMYLLLEGIETERDVVLAHNMHIDYGQGYYFSRPVLPRIV